VRVDHCGIGKDARFAVIGHQIRHVDRTRGLLEKRGPVYDCAVRIRATEIIVATRYIAPNRLRCVEASEVGK
jgi:hypothetical protein